MNTTKNVILASGAPGDIQLTGEITILAAAADKPGPRRFEMLAYHGGALKLPGFPLPVVVDLATIQGTDRSIPVLKDHDHGVIVGHIERVANDGRMLAASGVMSGAGAATKEIIEAADNGFPWAVSIGGAGGTIERVPPGATVTVNHQKFTGPVLVARGATLKEISFVSIPADDQATARIAAHLSTQENPMGPFDNWLQAKGIAAAELTDALRSTLQAAFDAEEAAKQVKTPAITANGGDIDKILADARAKEERAKAICELTASAISDNPQNLQAIEALSRQALGADWTRDRYELELLRANKPTIITRNRHGDEGLSNKVIEAAACLAGGIESPEKHFPEPVLEASAKRFPHGMGLGEMLLFFAHRNGYTGHSTSNVGPLLRAAFRETSPQITASGISTLSLPGILSNVANKFLKAGFEGVESTWRQISAKRTVNDFKQITSYSLTGDFTYEELPPGGQIKHGEVGEETYTNQAKTYGRMFGIDRRDIINDDLGALTSIPRKLGRGGALKLNLVFWTAFMNNASFFTTARGNYLEGATAGTNDTRLNIEGLGRGDLAFRNQTDPDGNPLGVAPRILLVPNALAITAANLMNSTELRNTTANTTTMNANPFAGQYQVVVSSYLSNANITGNSATATYLLADPADLPVIEVAFLNGVETPTVEQADADFNQLGIQMRGYHDFGVGLQEYRGGVKLKGAAA